MISQVTGLPAVFVRKEAKTYGTCQLAEGAEIDGRRLCIVEDVVTSGGAILDAASELRARGAMLGPVICVIDRESGGREKLAVDDLELLALYTMSELKARLQRERDPALRSRIVRGSSSNSFVASASECEPSWFWSNLSRRGPW